MEYMLSWFITKSFFILNELFTVYLQIFYLERVLQMFELRELGVTRELEAKLFPFGEKEDITSMSW